MGAGSFPGVKQPGCGVDNPPLSSAEVKDNVTVHLLPLWAIVPFSWVNFNFTITFIFTLRSVMAVALHINCFVH
jgi:hypothetical protein